MIQSVIDIGTNSSRLLIAETPSMKVLFRDIMTTRIGEGLGKGSLSITEEARKRNLDCLKKYRDEIEKFQAQPPIILGTQALREASNSREVLEEVKKELGWEIQIIPGEKEATLSFNGAVKGKNISSPMVIDIGGGSTELMLKTQTGIQGRSAKLGSLRLFENPRSQEEIRQILLDGWQGLNIPEKGTLIGVGGTATTLGAICLKMKQYDSELIEGTKITKKQVWDTIDLLESLPSKERVKLPGMMKGREDIMPWGLRLLAEALEICQAEDLLISDKDLMFGILE